MEVELDLHNGLPNFTVVGLGDAAVQESRERVRSAVKNSGFFFPAKKIVASLAPADVRKTGPSFDLPIALGLLLSSEQVIPTIDICRSAFLGELALDGSLRHITGTLPMAIGAQSLGLEKLFVPEDCAKEANLATELEVYPVRTLRQLIDHLTGVTALTPLPKSEEFGEDREEVATVDFSSIRGQEQAKRALEIAAAGSHNVLMNGAPGAGKTLMAKAFQSILPPLTKPEAIEVAKVHSIAGELSPDHPLPRRRPFRMVHHTASAVAIVGGGTRIRPGEISLAHRGVLFLDEFVEFPSQVLEVLRQPLEDRKITISRAQGSVTFPAQFTLIAAMNPPGTTANDPLGKNASPYEIQKFQKKISGPIIDRIDLYLDIAPVEFEKLSGDKDGDNSAVIAKRVRQAKAIQSKRFQGTTLTNNAEMGVDEVESFCSIDAKAKELLQRAMQQFGLSARSYHRILKVARTIADLAGEEQISAMHVAEALQYRPKFQGAL